MKNDTEYIQSLLDKKGDVYISEGIYTIEKPLIIHSDTYLKLSKKTVLRLAEHANCSILDNDGLYSHETNKNITIDGGIWDGNHEHQERKKIPGECMPGDINEDQPCDEKLYIQNIYIVLMMRFVHTNNLCIKNVTFKNPTSFAVHIADAIHFTVENVFLDYNLSHKNMDGVHIQGPARFGKITNIRGNANDDHVALCADGTVRSEITRGNIEDIDIDGIYCSNGYTGVRLLSRGNAVRNITIKNIHGQFRYYAVSFTHHYRLRDDRPILLENIHISDLFVSKPIGEIFPTEHEIGAKNNPLIWFESDIFARNITIENIHRSNDGTTAPTIKISPRANIERLILDNIIHESPNAKAFLNEGNIKEISL